MICGGEQAGRVYHVRAGDGGDVDEIVDDETEAIEIGADEERCVLWRECVADDGAEIRVAWGWEFAFEERWSAVCEDVLRGDLDGVSGADDEEGVVVVAHKDVGWSVETWMARRGRVRRGRVAFERQLAVVELARLLDGRDSREDGVEVAIGGVGAGGGWRRVLGERQVPS